MKNTMKAACCALILAVLPAAAADTTQVPRMFKGMQKGQWKADIESSASKSGEAIQSCTTSSTCACTTC